MSARRTAAIALVSLVPIWVYALLIDGGPTVALASSVCVLLVAGSLYRMFGPHDSPDAGLP